LLLAWARRRGEGFGRLGIRRRLGLEGGVVLGFDLCDRCWPTAMTTKGDAKKGNDDLKKV
jgi:hypothetical protein